MGNFVTQQGLCSIEFVSKFKCTLNMVLWVKTTRDLNTASSCGSQHVAISGKRTTWHWRRHTLDDQRFISAHLPANPRKEARRTIKKPNKHHGPPFQTATVQLCHDARMTSLQTVPPRRSYTTSVSKNPDRFLYALTVLLRPLCSPHMLQLR
jgi:hypothetical protein